VYVLARFAMFPYLTLDETGTTGGTLADGSVFGEFHALDLEANYAAVALYSVFPSFGLAIDAHWGDWPPFERRGTVVEEHVAVVSRDDRPFSVWVGPH
jgi:hypothetical protein